MTFSFSGSDIGVGLDHFECSIDGSSFSTCVTPAQYTNLSLGAHTLEVRAVDKVENAAETPTVFLWTITTPQPQQPPQQLPPSVPQNITTSPPVGANQSIVTNETTQIPPSGEAPDTKVVSAVDGSANALANDGITTSNSITFVLSASIAGAEAPDINNFECSIDGSSFSNCTSPVQYDNLSNGSHIVEIRTEDNAGNKDPSPSSFTWTVNTVQQDDNVVDNITSAAPIASDLPDTVINSTTDRSSNPIENETSTPSSAIRIEFSTTNVEGLDHFECSMDDSEFVPCTSPFIFPILPEGRHVFMVRFVDVNGNMDESPATFVWDIT
jgi:hypothetical protein